MTNPFAAAAALVSGLLLAVSVAGGAGAAERKSHAAIVMAAVDSYIVPGLEKLAGSTKALAESVEAACRDGSKPGATTDAKAKFAAAIAEWAALEFVRMGPTSEKSRGERLFFWPDPKGYTLRQLSQTLAAPAPTPEIATASAAIQGLGALELLLYDDKLAITADAEKRPARCAVAGAIANNIVKIAAELNDGWTAPDGFRLKVLTPGSDNPLYKDASETGRDVLKAIVTGIELETSRFVTPEFEAAAATPPKRARLPFEKSGLSSAYLAAALDGLSRLFDATGLITYAGDDKAWMVKFSETTFKDLSKDALSFNAAKTAPPGDETRLAIAKKLKFGLNGMRQIIVRELAPAADLTLGFNELDGD